MKKILVLNASPKREKSHTLVATKCFIEGLNYKNEYDIEYINISDLNIKPCIGCLSCWARTEGECVIKDDDIPVLKEKILNCDIFILSYPLYFFGMPGTLKVLTDRMLSMMMTYRGQEAPEDGQSFHGLRYYNDKQKFIIITSCAYTDAEKIYEPLIMQYDYICGKNNYLFIPVAQLMTLIELQNEAKINKLKDKYILAGKEYADNLCLSDETYKNLIKPPFTKGAYKVFLGNFWELEKKKGESK